MGDLCRLIHDESQKTCLILEESRPFSCLRLPSKQLPDSNKGQAAKEEPRILVEDGNEEQDRSRDAEQPEYEAVVECVFGWWLHGYELMMASIWLRLSWGRLLIFSHNSKLAVISCLILSVSSLSEPFFPLNQG